MRWQSSLHDRGSGVAQSLVTHQESLGGTEAQEHVEPHGHVVGVVGNIEVHDALIFPVLFLQVAELQAAVFHVVVTLDGLLALIEQASRSHAVPVGYGEVHDVSLFPPRHAEAACPKENVEHVVDTISERLRVPDMCAVILLAMLADVALIVLVRIEYLVHGVTLALAGSLAIIERLHLGGRVAEQGVTQDEHAIHLLASPGSEAGAIGWLALVYRLDGGEAGVARLHPDELPVIVKVVGEELTRRESGVAKLALCLGSDGDDGQQCRDDDVAGLV